VRCGRSSVGEDLGRGLRMTWALYLCRLSLTSDLGGGHDCCIPRLIHSYPYTPRHHFVAMPQVCPFVPVKIEFSTINQSICHQLILQMPRRVFLAPVSADLLRLQAKRRKSTASLSPARCDACKADRQYTSPHSIDHTDQNGRTLRPKRWILSLRAPVVPGRSGYGRSAIACNPRSDSRRALQLLQA